MWVSEGRKLSETRAMHPESNVIRRKKGLQGVKCEVLRYCGIKVLRYPILKV
jgi:hypothetical protein